MVYLYNGLTFDTVVNFNAAIGDKWRELSYSIASQCNNKRSYYEVIDTDRVVVNNFSLKRILTKCIYTSTSTVFGTTTYTTVKTYTIQNVFVERLLMQGSTHSNIADLFRYNCESSGIPEYPFVNFSCYHDDFFPLCNVSDTSCDNLTDWNEQSESLSGIKIYPNPAQTILKIESDGNDHFVNIEISSISGQTLKNLTVAYNSEINLEDLSAGIYFLTVKENGKHLGTRKIIKN